MNHRDLETLSHYCQKDQDTTRVLKSLYDAWMIEIKPLHHSMRKDLDKPWKLLLVIVLKFTFESYVEGISSQSNCYSRKVLVAMKVKIESPSYVKLGERS